jgi:hypothetical protein
MMPPGFPVVLHTKRQREATVCEGTTANRAFQTEMRRRCTFEECVHKGKSSTCSMCYTDRAGSRSNWQLATRESTAAQEVKGMQQIHEGQEFQNLNKLASTTMMTSKHLVHSNLYSSSSGTRDWLDCIVRNKSIFF